MTHPTLSALLEDRFNAEFSFMSNPVALHDALQRSDQVDNIRTSLHVGILTEGTIEIFCTELTRSIEFGKRFPYEIGLAAVAVAIEKRQTKFAKRYISQLSSLRVSELAIATRVARLAAAIQAECSDSYGKSFTSTTSSLVQSWTLVDTQIRESVNESGETFMLEAC